MFGAELNAAAFDTQTLTPVGSPLTLSVPREDSQEVTLGAVLIAPLGPELVIATYQVGLPTTLLSAGRDLKDELDPGSSAKVNPLGSVATGGTKAPQTPLPLGPAPVAASSFGLPKVDSKTS